MKMRKPFLILAFIALALPFFNCSNDDNTMQIGETANRAPETFNLLTVSDGATEVDVKPTFSWSAAIDPDGDSIGYELFVDTHDNPTTSIASNISGTEFTPENRLSLNENLFWKVTATDGKGHTTSSNTFGFTTRNLKMPSTPATANAAFSARRGHGSVVFDNKMWVIGGDDGASHLNDVWQSIDGETWTQITSEAPFHKRKNHATVVFDDKIWVIGGDNGADYLSDIWQSGDGENWTLATGAFPFPPIERFSVVVFQNNLWVLGKRSGPAKTMNTIWKSSDGETWINVETQVPFTDRFGYSTVVFDGKIWIVGGKEEEGISSNSWHSSDGVIWTQITESTAFTELSNHTMVTFDNKMWAIAGRDSKTRTDNIYQSSDGISWREVIEEIPFIERSDHTTVVFDDKIWVIGGLGGGGTSSYLNDVWAMD